MRHDMIEPPLTDDSGYRVTPADLSFLGIADASFAAFRRQQYPLGCDPDEWKQFVESLQQALEIEGITDAQVRLQGSAARFFAGRHKTMPYGKEEIADLFLSLRGRTPSLFESERTARALAETWPDEDGRPRRRPFDALYRLRIDRNPSDIDVQVSSAQILDRVKLHLARAGLPPSQLLVENPKYAFIRKQHIAVTCPYLTNWHLVQSDILDRPVTLAVFGGDGPPRLDDLPQSSHHQPGDWLVR
ncbi:hypothetical protein ACQPZX_28820 [Actinoplanes sp. CA-142083]|uniref:hypothetical protein n=1 Tax=Actinoplanes sp. CA-142083 TaxID=3239903 RepID=UPI003D8DF506